MGRTKKMTSIQCDVSEPDLKSLKSCVSSRTSKVEHFKLQKYASKIWKSLTIRDHSSVCLNIHIIILYFMRVTEWCLRYRSVQSVQSAIFLSKSYCSAMPYSRLTSFTSAIWHMAYSEPSSCIAFYRAAVCRRSFLRQRCPSVRLSVCPSVRYTRELWQNERKFRRDSYTT